MSAALPAGDERRPATARGQLHQSFLAYRGAHYVRFALLATGLAALAYLLHEPFDGRNGGTWLGYALGGVAAGIMIWLALLGWRKRNYRSRLGTVEGWLSAHVYFGAALPVIATLHSGGELGWNIHGASYVLMMAVVLTGLGGVYLYRRYPALIAADQVAHPPEQLRAELADLDGRCLALAGKLGEDARLIMTSAIQRTVLADSWWSLLSARDRSRVVLPRSAAGVGGLRENAEQRALLEFFAEQLGRSGGAAQTLWLQELVDLCARRQRALGLLRRDLRRRWLLAAWLRLHVPLTFAALAALAAHIVSVLAYR